MCLVVSSVCSCVCLMWKGIKRRREKACVWYKRQEKSEGEKKIKKTWSLWGKAWVLKMKDVWKESREGVEDCGEGIRKM